MKINKLLSSFLFAAALLLTPAAQAEAEVRFLHYTDGSVMAVFVYLGEAGDSVSEEIVTFAVQNGVYIWIDAGPGLIIECVDGLLQAVRG